MNRSIPSCASQGPRRAADGFTLIELLVTVTIAGIVVAAALMMTLSSRRLYAGDERRTQLTQQLRSGMDLVGLDVRQAGQGLPQDFPALVLQDGGGNTPDTVIVRRNMHDTVLPLCGAIIAGTAVDEIQVADSGGAPPAGCSPLGDSDGDGWPDNLDEWRDYRTSQGGVVDVFVFNPVSAAGQFVAFDGDGSTNDFLRTDSVSPWQIDCPIAEQCRVYVLDEHRYQVVAGLLQYVVNGNPALTVDLIENVAGFQARARLVDGSLLGTLAPTDDWSNLLSLEIDLSGQVVFEDRTIDRTLNASFMPRNVLSL